MEPQKNPGYVIPVKWWDTDFIFLVLGEHCGKYWK